VEETGAQVFLQAKLRTTAVHTADGYHSPTSQETAPKYSKLIGVPGEIRGSAEPHRLYGKLLWADIFQPTIKLAREGFPIPQLQGHHNSETVKNDRTLFPTRGKFVKVLIIRCVVFSFAQQIHLFHCFCSGGNLTLEDSALCKVTVTDYRMYFPPPPAGGTILSLILNIMKGYKMESEPNTTDEKILFYHRYIEALKFANGLKKHIRDPNFSSDKNLTEDSFANHIRSLISSDKTHDPQYYGKNSYLDSIGTTHVSVLAEDGSAVSVTSSINDEFGSNVLSSSTGIILNNHLNDFCGRADNIFHGKGSDVVDGLEALGHKVAKFYNTVNAVEKAGNCISAWSDERKNGKAAGY
uniref:Gamma-glutamyltransferase 5-like n=1 Tax=Pundamilia nyererei TaxID=303518 RepID=A0A3B4EZG9_9CICH